MLSYFTLNVLVTFFCVPACLPVCFADCLTFAKVISLYHRFCLCRVSMMGMFCAWTRWERGWTGDPMPNKKSKNNITTTPCCESCNTPTTGQLWEYSTFTTYGAEFWHTCTVTLSPYSGAQHPGLKETQGRRTTFPLRTYAHPGDHSQHLIIECAFFPRHSITMLSTPNCKAPRG